MNNIEIDIEDLKDKMNKGIEGSGWEPALSPFVNGLEFNMIVTKLISLVNVNRRFTPQFKDIFNPFKECLYKDLKVIIISQDPYPQLGISDGIAFSCSKTGKAEKSLQYILEETIGNSTDTGKAIYNSEECDLRRWSNQGVLLLTTALTCEINSIGSHVDLWSTFTKHLLEFINLHHKNIPVIFMGKKSEIWEIYLSNQKLFKCPHPVSASYNGGVWKADNIFGKVNEELERQVKPCIIW
jgi:uracil-DNA glycosylase